MNLPNKLTVLRIAVVPLMIATLLIGFPHHYLASGLLFGIAALTDFFDGRIARKRNLITDFGKFADPLADKILVISALVCFAELHLTSSVVAIVVLFREFAVTSIRLVAASNGKVVAANMWGKAKTVSQIIAISVTFALQYIAELMSMSIIPVSADIFNQCTLVFYIVNNVCLWISAALALISGIIYIKDNREFIKTI